MGLETGNLRREAVESKIRTAASLAPTAAILMADPANYSRLGRVAPRFPSS